MQPDPFEGPKLKVERAKRHITDYRMAFKAFADANVIRGVPQTDVETRKLELAFPPLPPAPGEMRLCAADALYNLRSALDQAVCRCARLACGSSEKTYFPHGKDKDGFEVFLRGKNARKFPRPSATPLPLWSHTMEGMVRFSEFSTISMWSITYRPDRYALRFR